MMPRLALMLALLLLLPMLPSPEGRAPWSAGVALADDDGDDDGGADDDGDDDDGSAFGGREAGGNRAMPRPGRRAQPTRPSAAPVLPDFAQAEVVALGLGAGDVAVLLALGYRVIEERSLPSLELRAFRLAVPPGRSLDVARAELRRIAPEAAADFNHFYRTETAPDRPAPCIGPACAARDQIRWPFPPLAQGCDPGGVVGMIDTGVNAGHAALVDRTEVIRLDPGPYAPSDAQHGTGVAALLVGAPDSPTPGLLPRTRLIAVDAFHKAGADERAEVFDLLAGLDLLADRGVRVINLSLSGPPNAVLERMVVALTGRGLLLVAAVGNSGARSGPAWPAAYPQVVGVTGVDARGGIYRRAGQGPHVELAAPGVQVWTAASVSGGRARNGTSFAAPFVTAAAHVLMGRGLAAREARLSLAATAADLGIPGADPVFGHGLLQAGRICDTGAG